MNIIKNLSLYIANNIHGLDRLRFIILMLTLWRQDIRCRQKTQMCPGDRLGLTDKKSTTHFRECSLTDILFSPQRNFSVFSHP